MGHVATMCAWARRYGTELCQRVSAAPSVQEPRVTHRDHPFPILDIRRISGTLVSYGASAVTRTSGRGHVAEAKTNVIEVGGFSIRA